MLSACTAMFTGSTTAPEPDFTGCGTLLGKSCPPTTSCPACHESINAAERPTVPAGSGAELSAVISMLVALKSMVDDLPLEPGRLPTTVPATLRLCSTASDSCPASAGRLGRGSPAATAAAAKKLEAWLVSYCASCCP